ncbi:Caffeine dehydrogenase subunit beta [Methylobacterium crusticola]|uniref:Caffeine dehydrogenase subunit beta n=1 Tax=Methylobacterium crusticola TaxID=1697972 RepID=A0ABQ4QUU6_9HYPH|nr:FAD binding domain-containing protein [Methylobacterium crusticola]GJD48680.1 Caffeine dehydrogenase subunit beta [Methylobacterium crusticola]
MKAAAFQYERPGDLPQAIALLAREGAKALGGGQSLGPMLNLRLARPALLVGLTHLDPLRSIADLGHAWRIGAAVTHARLEDERLAGAEMLAAVASDIAYRSIRTRGTIGGSLVHADPAADWPLALATLDAVVEIEGPSGRRRCPAETFMQAAFTVDLAADEIVTAVEVPKTTPDAAWSAFKFCRKQGDFAQASAAILLDPDRRAARVFCGALDGPPRPLPGIARRLAEGLALPGDTVERELGRLVPDLDPIALRMHAAAIRRAADRLGRSA